MIFETVVVGAYQVNCYVLAYEANSSAIIIDPGDQPAKIKKVLNEHKLTAAAIINTHGHIDHIKADEEFGALIYAHNNDLPLLASAKLNLSDFLSSPYSVNSKVQGLVDGQVIEIGRVSLEVIHTPGHTPGGICLLMREPQGNILFSGDTLFKDGVGRTDFPGADSKLLISSITQKLLRLSDDIVVYPGHGPSTTIGEERMNNPFLF